MEICTKSNLVALADITSTDLGLDEVQDLSFDQLQLLVDNILSKIHLLHVQDIGKPLRFNFKI